MNNSITANKVFLSDDSEVQEYSYVDSISSNASAGICSDVIIDLQEVEIETDFDHNKHESVFKDKNLESSSEPKRIKLVKTSKKKKLKTFSLKGSNNKSTQTLKTVPPTENLSQERNHVQKHFVNQESQTDIYCWCASLKSSFDNGIGNKPSNAFLADEKNSGIANLAATAVQKTTDIPDFLCNETFNFSSKAITKTTEDIFKNDILLSTCTASNGTRKTGFKPENIFQESLYRDLGVLPDEIIANNDQENTNPVIGEASYFTELQENIHKNGDINSNTPNRSFSGPLTTLNDLENKNTKVARLLKKLIDDAKTSLMEDEDGNIPLHHAVLDRNIIDLKKQCILLKSIKYNINHTNCANETALVLAVKVVAETKGSDCEAVALLVREGADQTIPDSDGYVPLHYAVMNSREDIVKVLLDARDAAKVIQRFDKDGLSPLHLAALGDSPTIIEMLIQQGANIEVQDRKSGRTPYFMALENGKMKAVQVLVAFDTKTSQKNFAGQLPSFSAKDDFKVKRNKLLFVTKETTRQITVENKCIEVEQSKSNINDTGKDHLEPGENPNKSKSRNSSILPSKKQVFQSSQNVLKDCRVPPSISSRVENSDQPNLSYIGASSSVISTSLINNGHETSATVESGATTNSNTVPSNTVLHPTLLGASGTCVGISQGSKKGQSIIISSNKNMNSLPKETNKMTNKLTTAAKNISSFSSKGLESSVQVESLNKPSSPSSIENCKLSLDSKGNSIFFPANKFFNLQTNCSQTTSQGNLTETTLPLCLTFEKRTDSKVTRNLEFPSETSPSVSNSSIILNQTNHCVTTAMKKTSQEADIQAIIKGNGNKRSSNIPDDKTSGLVANENILCIPSQSENSGLHLSNTSNFKISSIGKTALENRIIFKIGNIAQKKLNPKTKRTQLSCPEISYTHYDVTSSKQTLENLTHKNNTNNPTLVLCNPSKKVKLSGQRCDKLSWNMSPSIDLKDSKPLCSGLKQIKRPFAIKVNPIVTSNKTLTNSRGSKTEGKSSKRKKS